MEGKFLDKIASEKPIKLSILLLFFIFIFINSLFLHKVPALVGDEGYEGLSVIDHIENSKPFLEGRESYVAFWSDYFRLPFILWLGPTALAMRLPMFLTSLATFWLIWISIKRIFGEIFGYYGLAFFAFSPAFILDQRISWPVFFLPFFASLLLFCLSSRFRQKPLISGTVAGIGLSTHTVFMAPLVGILGGFMISNARKWRRLRSWWTFLIGIFAGFGLQLAILLFLSVENARVGSIWNLGKNLRQLLPTIISYFSNSSYIGEYLGETPAWSTLSIFFLLSILVFFAVILKPKRKTASTWLLGIGISLLFTTIMVNYFRTRYFHVTTLAFWTLAGIGLAKLTIRTKNKYLINFTPITVAILLCVWMIFFVFIPYTKTGGTTKNFPDSATSWDTAAHFASIDPLVACLENKPTVFAKEPKIRNRLSFIAYRNKKLSLTDKRSAAPIFVDYRSDESIKTGKKRNDEICPELSHFVVIPNPYFQNRKK